MLGGHMQPLVGQNKFRITLSSHKMCALEKKKDSERPQMQGFYLDGKKCLLLIPGRIPKIMESYRKEKCSILELPHFVAIS
jgi:hypothetical protein